MELWLDNVLGRQHQVTKCKRFYSFIKVREKYQEENLKLTKYLLSGGENNAFNMKTVFM